MSGPTGQEPTNRNDDTQPDPTPTTPPEETKFDASYVKDLRSEAANYRKELRAAQKRLEEIEAAQEAAKTAELEQQGKWQELAEQKASEAKELEAQLERQRQELANERRANIALSVATRLGAIDPGDANFAAAVSAIDVNAEDATEQITRSLEALKEARPYLFGKRVGNLASFNPTGQVPPPPGETDNERRRRLWGGGSHPMFDTEAAEVAGGGVIWPKGEPD